MLTSRPSSSTTSLTRSGTSRPDQLDDAVGERRRPYADHDHAGQLHAELGERAGVDDDAEAAQGFDPEERGEQRAQDAADAVDGEHVEGIVDVPDLLQVGGHPLADVSRRRAR